MIEGLRGDLTVAELSRKEGIAESMYYAWSKEFQEAGRSRLPLPHRIFEEMYLPGMVNVYQDAHSNI